MIWPDNADGDVFRRLESQGFDFSMACWVDFNIDFDVWPPQEGVVEQIKHHFPDAVVTVEEDDEEGCLLIRLFDTLTYEFVLRVQDELSKIAAPFSGRCESWGVLHG